MAAVPDALPDIASSPTAVFLKRAAELLAYDKAPRSEREFALLACRPVAPEVVDRLVKSGVPARCLAFITPRRTLSHRKARGEMLTRDEGDRSIRAARLLALGETAFGGNSRALQWLGRPVKKLDGRTPLDILASESGARLVEELLVGLDEGFFA